MLRKLLQYGWLLLVICPLVLEAQVHITRHDQPLQLLNKSLGYAEDPNDSLTIDHFLLDRPNHFKSFSEQKSFSGRSTWWVKAIILPTFTSDNFYLGLPGNNLSGLSQGNDNVDVWIIQNMRVVAHYLAGNLAPSSARPITDPINHNLVPVSLKKDSVFTVLWKVRQTLNTEDIDLNFSLIHRSMIHSGSEGMNRLAWFYIGLMSILFIFGLVFFIITREKPFIWYTALAFFFCTHMSLLHPENYLTRIFFPENPSLQYQAFSVLTLGATIILLQFVRTFNNLSSWLPRWDKMILIVMGVLFIMMVSSVILQNVTPPGDIPEPVFSLVFAAILVFAVRLMVTKNIYARITGTGLGWLFIFQTLGILWNNHIIPSSFPNPWVIAQFGMMVIFFFALAYRFKQSAKEKAEAAKILEMDAIKSRFFANISHEFRTPLTLMLGPLKQMEEGELNEAQQKKYTRIMRRNGDRLLQLMNQLLDLSKLESGKMDLQVARTDITSTLKSIASSFDSLAEEKQVNYHLYFPEENIIGYVDRDKLEKIIVNLLANAFRFTSANGTVSFSAEQDEKRLRFTVQDNGVGMPKEQLTKIFDRFHQVSGTEGGTGIGLSLAKELLQLHKGQISVQSETGKGSSFRVSIPIAAEFYMPAELGSSPAGYSNSLIRSENDPEVNEEIQDDPDLPIVLIVEDNKDLQQYIGDILHDHFRFQVAGNGKIGLQKAIEIVPDCIISDVMMPEMDGIELCKRLKQEPATNHIPLILLTAKAGSGSRIEGLQTGADDYIVKPFDGPELITRIQNLIDQRKQLRERWSKQVISINPEKMVAPSVEQGFISSVRTSIEENIDNELFGVAELANAIHLSRSQLHRKLKSLTGQSPNELIRNYRLERAMQLLEQHVGTITEIAYQTGFSSPAYFSKCFSDRYGYAPTEVNRKSTKAQ